MSDPDLDSVAATAPIVAVVGPTASGKSRLALDLAQALGAEIINTDSMALYRGMDIGTAKVPVDQRRGVPHHLIDVLAVDESASVAEFQEQARAVINAGRARGVGSILVGGSALYTRAVLDQFEFPGTDPQVRDRWEKRLDEVGADALHAELAERDPVAAAAILASNGRRIVRALEVIELTGQPFSASLPRLEYFYDDAFQVGLEIEREDLDDRIARRVVAMWEEGFVDEVRGLSHELRRSRTAAAAIGYQQVLAMLAGEINEAEAMLLTVQATRRFARRQDSWFKKDPRITWLPYDAPDLLQRALEVVRHP